MSKRDPSSFELRADTAHPGFVKLEACLPAEDYHTQPPVLLAGVAAQREAVLFALELSSAVAAANEQPELAAWIKDFARRLADVTRGVVIENARRAQTEH